MKKILIVEDDCSIVNLLKLNLSDLDCHFTVSYTGSDAVALALATTQDLIILDVMLPDANGFTICKQMREHRIATPILMLTSKSEERDKVLGLESGADDYMTKPFSIKELLARVKAIFRRDQLSKTEGMKGPAPKLCFSNMILETETRKLFVHNKRVELSPKEYDLLILFASHPGRSYTREMILNLVWGYDFEGFEHTVNSHINRLRVKIEPDIANPQYILTTWGVGYRFSEEV